MSTKIYNAYKFDGTLEELLDILFDFKQKWLGYQTLRIAAVLTWDFEKKEAKPIKEVEFDFDDICNLVEKQTSMLYPRWDQKFDIRGSATVYSFEGNLYVQFFIDTEPFNTTKPKFVEENEKFTDFHFQNQADPYWAYDENYKNFTEEEIKEFEKDWDNRRRVWDGIMKNSGVPNEAGLTYPFAEPCDAFTVCCDVTLKIKEMKEKE